MKILISNLFIIAAIAFGATSCSNRTQTSSHVINGRITGQDKVSFSVVNADGDTLTLPKTPGMTPNMKIFLQDSVWIRYSKSNDEIVVDEVILIAHKQPLSNVDELFIGSWNAKDSSMKITFNTDQTTDTAGQRWHVSGKKVFLHTDQSSLVYDIVRVDGHTMTLCHADHTLHLHRVNQ